MSEVECIVSRDQLEGMKHGWSADVWPIKPGGEVHEPFVRCRLVVESLEVTCKKKEEEGE